MTRRTFLTTTAAATLAPAAFPATPGIRYGCAAITWGKEDRQAIDDIAAAGYHGIQLRAEAVTEFKPDELRALLAQRKLTFVALSSGDVSIDPAAQAEIIATHAANAKFVKDAGCLYLQVLDQSKPYPRTVTPGECKQLGKLLTELGKRTADLGMPLVYHNHMNSISEHPGNLAAVLDSSDPRYMHLLLDVAHYAAGGGNPAEAIETYRERIRLVHLKDVVDIAMDSNGAKYPFQWVELGRGRVDLPAVFAALENVKYRGWALVELDKVTDKSTTAKDSALISRKYLEDKIGVKF